MSRLQELTMVAMMQLIAQLQRLADQLKQCDPLCNMVSHESGHVRREKDTESSRSVGIQSASDSDANVKLTGKDKEIDSSFGAARARRLALHQQASPGLHILDMLILDTIKWQLNKYTEHSINTKRTWWTQMGWYVKGFSVWMGRFY